MVKITVSLEFNFPVIKTRFEETGQLVPFATVPEATINEDAGRVFGEHKIEFATKIRHMQAITEPHAMDQAAQFHFRACVLGPDTRHALAALFGCKGVGQNIIASV